MFEVDIFSLLMAEMVKVNYCVVISTRNSSFYLWSEGFYVLAILPQNAVPGCIWCLVPAGVCGTLPLNRL